MGGEARAFLGVDGDRMVLLPLVLREVPLAARQGDGGGWMDASSPYGYPGLWVTPGRGDVGSLLRMFCEELSQRLAELRVVSVFVRLDPFSNAPESLDRGTVVRHGETVWINLERSHAELDAELRSGTKRDVARGVRDGLRVECDEEGRGLAEFTDLYHRTMRRVGAEEWYLFTAEYLHNLWSEGRGRVRLFVTRDGKRLASAGLFSECCRTVQYLLSARGEARGDLHATKVMLVHVRDWARGRGNARMHLGGGVGGGGDGLLQFKRGFSQQRTEFWSWRWIVNEREYEKRVATWERQTGCIADDARGFFPAYRKGTVG